VNLAEVKKIHRIVLKKGGDHNNKKGAREGAFFITIDMPASSAA